jgi:glycosyltransferase involved in cell wall biosynthesis
VKILFLLPYPLQKAPSQRFRIEAYFPLLKQHKFDIDTQVFLDKQSWDVLYKKGSHWQKIKAISKGFAKRWTILFAVKKYDFIVVHREAAPLGPPVFEWIITKLLKRKMIYDFDDAIWIPAISKGNKIAIYLKCFWKIKWICKWAYKVVAGNPYLAEYARQHGANVFVVPTAVDTSYRYNFLANQNVSKPSIGWTGSHSTIKYLNAIFPVLERLEEKYDFDFIVICNERPAFHFRSLKFIEWNEKTEMEDLSRINIGIMPLENDIWSEGKCGFKLIQYLSIGIPSIASPVGVNKKIIDKNTGFLCSTHEEWYHALSMLLSDSSLRTQMGKAGRQKIISEYSIEAHSFSFLKLFGTVINVEVVFS